jgi:hypothetical protein
MKDEQPISRDTLADSLLDSELEAVRISPENEHDSVSVAGRSQRSVRTITDSDLASAAYAQSVALRDSCVQHAMGRRVPKPVPIKARPRPKS